MGTLASPSSGAFPYPTGIHRLPLGRIQAILASGGGTGSDDCLQVHVGALEGTGHGVIREVKLRAED